MLAVADSSVIVAAALVDHEAFDECRRAIDTADAGAAGHAWIESFSVLTRLPADIRLGAADAVELLASVVPRTVGVTSTQMASFRTWLARHDVVGGAVYDALVAWAAKSNELPLLTRDQRAAPTYERVGVAVHLLHPTM